MMTRVDPHQIEGKTVRGCVDWAPDLVITFTDGTYLHMRAEADYERDADLCSVNGDICGINIPDAEAERIGLYTKAEIDGIRAMRDRERQEAQKYSEIELVKRLILKYGIRGIE